MKLARMGIVVAAAALLVCSGTEFASATRVFGAKISGEVTATPMSNQIEVDHRVFHFAPNSPADKAARGIRVGEKVDLMLDAPATTNGVHVVSIVKHSAS